MIKFVDMFSGIGGFREGLTRAGGFTCVGHCEIDKYANRSYNALFDTKGEWFIEDARKADPSTMPDFQLLCGGFPCQTFSIAGSRKGFGDPRGTLFFELARLAEARKPPYLLFENVPGLLSHDGGRTFATILNTLDRLGYGVEWQCLNSKDFGVPQSRNRVYIIGYLDERWQSYRNKANFPKMVAAACIINDGSSDDRFTDFRNWLIMQGYDAYRQALIDPDNLAALNIPFRDTEWMGCGNVAWYAYAGQQLHTYFEKEEIAAKLFRKYPALLKSSADLHQAIMQEQLAPHRAQETEWERQMLRTEVKHYIEVSGLAYSYNKFYAQNAPDKVAWETLQSDLFSNLPQIKAERMPQDFSVVLPKLWRKRQAWDAERTKRPPYRGEER